MARWFFLVTLIFSVTITLEVNAYSVLFVGAVGSKSHKNFYTAISEELSKNGHQITLVTPFPSKTIKNNIREVVVPEGNVGKLNLNFFEESFSPRLSSMAAYFKICDQSFSNRQVQELSREKFDVVFVSAFFCDCYLSLVHQLQVPFIYVSPMGLLSTTAEAIGNPPFPAFLNVPILQYKHPFTFFQRTVNVLLETVGGFLFHDFIGKMEDRCRNAGLCSESMPPFEELQRNVSLIILNSVRELELPPRPYVPGVVHAGGIHCRPAKPLPQDLQEWIEGAGEDGFIFFSLGSVVKSTDLPEENRQTLVKVFSSLKQRVLWKWDADSMPDLPPNVKIMKWLPQQDILGHPKLRLFITHGGLFSTYESIYHGTPILGLPVFADQLSNMKEVERQGWGKLILWNEMTEDVLLQKMSAVMHNEQVRQYVQMQSSIMKDQPMSPQETVVFWTEYVIRHNGAKHLRSPIADLPWYIIYNIDVWSMVVLLMLLVLWLGVRLLRAVTNPCRRMFKNKTD